ncbi:MAG: hypothetical protein ACXVFN_14025 [Solirubrobacteraceae bacterium]
MQPVSPNRWRALPTAALVILAIVLGAATARAADGGGHPAHAGASPAAALR